LSGQFSLLSKDAGIAHGTTRLAGSYRGLKIYATNFGSSLNYTIESTYSENSYGFPFRISQDRFLSLNRTNPLQSLDKWVDELPMYLVRLNGELENARTELNRAESIKGKIFYRLGRLNEVQEQLLIIREKMAQDKNVLNVSSSCSSEDNEEWEYLEMGEDLSSTEVGVNLQFVEDLKSLNFTEYCDEKNISNYLEDIIQPQLKELRVLKLTKCLEMSCKENNLMRVAMIYKSCKDFPQHWTSALKALSLENKKVCMKTLAKLKAVA
jgi:hypothetical protein